MTMNSELLASDAVMRAVNWMLEAMQGVAKADMAGRAELRPGVQ